ncbi:MULTISPECIES: hypothetical protein [unclassified Paludibacterium]|uniref:hypothetical protein n=1 Tax=unclassified Paludibacterium TaxID=2618429 RepID=UPI001C05BA02|nr:hypothetical protein [Paludibacterium sp. B53371]BEV71798.1 hypothetical protein THUN1379_12800 [Paludibacterium sp. THUN1379]
MMRVKDNPADIGRCGCGRREYCDGSHALTEEAWQALQARERAAQQGGEPAVDEADLFD